MNFSLPPAKTALTNLICDGHGALAAKLMDHAERHHHQLQGPQMLMQLPFWPWPDREIADRFYAQLETLERAANKQNVPEN